MEELRIGVYVCHCGSNIGGTVNCPEVSAYAQGLPNVTIARDNMYTCSDAGQKIIKDDIKEFNLNRVVVASCSPRMHEPTFKKVVEEAGLNPFYMQMANIREHVSWVCTDIPTATAKAKDLVRAAVARVSHHEQIIPQEIPITKKMSSNRRRCCGNRSSFDCCTIGLPNICG